MIVHVGLLLGLMALPRVAVPFEAPQASANEVVVGKQVLAYEAPVTNEQAREVATLVVRTFGGAEVASVHLRRTEEGYVLLFSFSDDGSNAPSNLQSASVAGILASASVFEGAPLTVRVADEGLEPKKQFRVELSPEDAVFYHGEALVLLERNVEAIEMLRKAVELRSNETRYLLRYGEVLFLEWRDVEAEDAFRAALSLEPENPRAHFLMGELTFQKGALQAALPFYRRAVELDPDFGRAHEMLASTYDLLSRFDEAIVHYKRAIEIEPSATRYNELGIAHRNKKEVEEAIREFRAGIELFPDHALLHRNLATTLVMAGRGDQAGPVFSKALELYRRAVESEPANPHLHASLGFMMAQVHDYDGAIASFRRALEIEPRAPLTWGGLGDAYISTKRFDEAIAAFLKMVELQKDDGYAHHRLARALETVGRSEDAEQAFERARQLGYSR